MSWVDIDTGGGFDILVKDFINKKGEESLIAIGTVSPMCVFSLKIEGKSLANISTYFDKELLLNHNVISEREEFYWESEDEICFFEEPYSSHLMDEETESKEMVEEKFPMGIFYDKEVVQEVKDKFIRMVKKKYVG